MKNLEDLYRQRFETALQPIANLIEKELTEYLKESVHIDRIVTRAKSIDRFLIKSEKVENDKKKYNDPLNQIQDQIGARIIVFYIDDVERIEKTILKYYHPIEKIAIISESEKEFGYIGKHLVLLIPPDVKSDLIDEKLVPRFFELQIKTLYQHAFSEASHDLAYKPSIELSKDQKRKIAFTAAQSWGADLIFSDLLSELSE